MVQAMDIPAVLGASGEVLLAMVDHRSDLKLMRVAIITPKAIRVDGYEEQETPGGNAVPGWNSSENTITNGRPGKRTATVLYCHVGLFLRAGRDLRDISLAQSHRTSPGLLHKQAPRTPKGPIHNTDRPRGRRPYSTQPRRTGKCGSS